MTIKDVSIVVFGATGAVGRTCLQLLAEMGASNVTAVASHSAGGRETPFGHDKMIKVYAPSDLDFSAFDFCIMATDDSVSEEWAKRVARTGCVVIDNSPRWRMAKDVPLVVPELNASKIKGRLVANPNCIVIPLCVVLSPLQAKVGIKRVVISTYQSTSGAGDKAMSELISQTKAFFMNASPRIEVFPKRIAFNVLPQIGPLQDDGNTMEEEKIAQEVCKIFNTDIPMSVTGVRVPTLIGHGISVNVECKKPITPKKMAALLEKIDGVLVVDRQGELQDGCYATPAEVKGTDPIYVSRIRADASVPHGLNLWIVSDNLRKGAALNAIQIIEHMISKKSLTQAAER